MPTRLSTLIQIILKYLNIIFVLENTLMSPVIKLVAIAPLTQLAHYESDAARNQLIISVFLIITRILSYFIFQKILVLRYQNDLIPWSKPHHYGVILDFIQHTLLILFICYFNINKLILALFQGILFTISAVKIYLEIQKPYFYDKNLALIKLNMDGFKCSYFLSTIFVQLMSLDRKGFSIVIILSVLSICSIINIINIKYQDKLIVSVLNNELTDPYQSELAIYHLLDIIFKKTNNHFSNEYDGIVHSLEMREDNNTFNTSYHNQKQSQDNYQMIFTSRLEQFYQENIDSQLEYLHKSNQPEKVLENSHECNTEKSGLYNLDNSMFFGNPSMQADIQFLNINTGPVNHDVFQTLVQESSNHTLAESFNYEFMSKQRLNELELERSNEKNSIDKIRDHEERLIREKIVFIADNLLLPYMKQNQDNIQLMFLKCFISLMHLKNRFICLTVVTAIDNLNFNLRYLDQVENKISQQYFLEICLSEQAKVVDHMDSTYFLDFNLRINEYFDLLLKGSKWINKFWSLLNSESNYKQIMKLEKLSLKISEILRKVKQSLRKIEQETPLLEVSEQILFYTATFYQMVLRDMHLSDFYLKQIIQNRSQMTMPNLKANFSNFDEISLAIVDGNFSNMGRLLYANKILLRHLGYKQEQVLMQTVHLLMPREIALVHDKFWNRFKETGIPSILECQRILFIKDRDGYAHPFNIFIKFIYHQKFGYTFLGIFKKQNKMIMNEIESPIKIGQFFVFITNQQGRITEISKNCEKLIGLDQQIFEHLSTFLEEGLHPYHFNPHLSISALDFSKGPSILINKALIDTSIVFKHTKELEYERDSQNRKIIKNKIQVQIKIVKETYGLGDVTLYYFMFAVIKEPIVDSIKEGILGKIFQRTNLGVDDKAESQEFQKVTDSFVTRFSMSGNQNFNSQSQSSCSVSSAITNGFDELKYLEDNIDYSKTPKQLLIVKLIFNTIIMMIIALTTTLLALNQIQISNQIDQLGAVKYANENMVLLSELSILSRSFININLGLEPASSSFFPDRKRTVLQQSLDIIEEMRINQKLLDFKNSQDQETTSVLNLSMVEKNTNGKISYQNLSYNFGLNSYMVKALDLFGYNVFISKELSYLQKSKDIITNKDLTVFYVITNQNGDIRLQTYQSAYLKTQDVIDKNESFVEITRIFMIIASCNIFIGVIAALYFYSKIIDNQSKTLVFFSELDKGLIDYCIQGSSGFYQFLSNDNDKIILIDSKIISQRKEVRLNLLEQKLVQIQDQRRQQSAINNTTNPNVFETSDMQLIKQQKGNKANRVKLEEFKDEDDVEDRINLESSGPQKFFKHIDMSQKKSLKGGNSITHNMADIMSSQQTWTKNKQKKLDKKIKKIKEKDDDDSKSEKYKIDQNEISESKSSKIERNDFVISNQDLKQIFMQWKLKKMGTYSMVFLGISSIFISYFIIQYLIVDKVHIKIKDHTIHLQQLYQGQACMNWLITDLREMQIRNDSSLIFAHNQSYDYCTLQNANFNLWMGSHSDNNDISNLNSKLNKNPQICDLIYQYYLIDIQNCQKIYSGILQKSIYQVLSVFFHDTLQAQISFTSQTKRDEKFLNSTISQAALIEMIDAKQQYLIKVNAIIANTVHDALSSDEKNLHMQQLYVFGIYIFALIASLIVLNCFVFVQMRKSIWNSKIIFKLLPIEELDISLKRRVQMFLFKP